MKVRILELADRYIIVDAETDLEVDCDDIGFSSKSAAVEYAEAQGWDILP